jgi:integrase
MLQVVSWSYKWLHLTLNFMPLELRIESNGTVRPFWYGRFKINGKRQCLNLGVKVHGTPPSSLSLKDEGDLAFERSRTTALAKLQSVVEEARAKRDSVHLVEKLYEMKTGETIRSVLLTELAEEWKNIARKREPDARYAAQCQAMLKRFVLFVNQENKKAEEIAHITRSLAKSFLAAESDRGITAKTWNDTLKLLRSTFKYMLPAGAINPFSDIPTKETETVFRKPYSPEELATILEAARTDEFIRPLIVTGMCTAMRRGDCCLLKWSDVNLGQLFITVKTSKTGQTVSIPIFPMLEEELQKRAKQSGVKREGYIFPELAKKYLENPDGITWRVKKVLAEGLGEMANEAGEVKALPEISNDEIRKRGEAHIATLPEGNKRTRMATVFRLYMDGKNIKLVLAEANVSKGSVSGYLNEIERAIGCRLVRGTSHTKTMKNGKLQDRMKDAGLYVERKHGLRRASVRDFHSFRVTWVTLALTAGVQLELVQKVTGHKTTDIVLKHYFQPGQEAFRKALQSAMPKLLMNGQKSPKDEMQEILAQTSAKTWKKDKARLEKLMTVF